MITPKVKTILFVREIDYIGDRVSANLWW